MPKIRINKQRLDGWTAPASGQQTFSDDLVPGFICVIGKEARTFYLQADVKGRTRRRKIGRYPGMSAQDARTEAMRLKAALRNGDDIFAKANLTGGAPAIVTVRSALADYLEAKQGKIKVSTATFYRWHVEKYLADWLDKPLKEIDRHMVATRFNKVTADNGWAAANNVMQTLSQIYNTAGVDDDALANPVDKFKKARGGLHEKKRRDGAIRPGDLVAWLEGIEALEDEAQRDYFMLVLYTGLRRTEAATLRWNRIDFRDGTFTVSDTKNGKPLTLPLTLQARGILERRQAAAGGRPWVFPSPASASGHIADPKSAVDRVRATIVKKIGEQHAALTPEALKERIAVSSAARFYTHGLRNTFINTGRRVLRIDRDLVKRLVNHATSRDVTEGYAGDWTIDQLRTPAQRISDTIDGMLYPAENVVKLQMAAS